MKSTDCIAGRQAKELRTALRVLRDCAERQGGRLDLKAVAGCLEIPDSEATTLIRDLVDAGLLEVERDGWRTTIEGNALAIAKFTKPFRREKAQEILGQFLVRVGEVNEHGSGWLFGIREVALFGSFLNPDNAVVGDVDLSVKTFCRIRPDQDRQAVMDLYNDFAETKGHRATSFFDQLSYPQAAMQRYVKGRSPILSVGWDSDDPAALGVDALVIYKCEPFADQP